MVKRERVSSVPDVQRAIYPAGYEVPYYDDDGEILRHERLPSEVIVHTEETDTCVGTLYHAWIPGWNEHRQCSSEERYRAEMKCLRRYLSALSAQRPVRAGHIELPHGTVAEESLSLRIDKLVIRYAEVVFLVASVMLIVKAFTLCRF